MKWEFHIVFLIVVKKMFFFMFFWKTIFLMVKSSFFIVFFNGEKQFFMVKNTEISDHRFGNGADIHLKKNSCGNFHVTIGFCKKCGMRGNSVWGNVSSSNLTWFYIGIAYKKKCWILVSVLEEFVSVISKFVSDISLGSLVCFAA